MPSITSDYARLITAFYQRLVDLNLAAKAIDIYVHRLEAIGKAVDLAGTEATCATMWVMMWPLSVMDAIQDAMGRSLPRSSAGLLRKDRSQVLAREADVLASLRRVETPSAKRFGKLLAKAHRELRLAVPDTTVGPLREMPQADVLFEEIDAALTAARELVAYAHQVDDERTKGAPAAPAEIATVPMAPTPSSPGEHASAPTTPHGAVPATNVATSKIKRALGILAEEPTWTTTRIAKAAGASRGYIARNLTFQAARNAYRNGNTPPHGSKSASGNVEAWNGQADEDG